MYRNNYLNIILLEFIFYVGTSIFIYLFILKYLKSKTLIKPYTFYGNRK